MKNLFVLPTDKPSRLQLQMNGKYHLENSQTIALKSFHNICITDDSEIKDGDWVLFKNNWIKKCNNEEEAEIYNNDDRIFKIILTTDQDLIKDGVQAIHNEFLEWFVKNPSCEEVKVNDLYNYTNENTEHIGYKIIIPKEELERGITITHVGKGESNPFELPKALPDDVFYKSLEPKQETLEEFAKQEAIKQYSEDTFGNLIVRKSIEKGAKWQQEQDKNKYSEEEVESFLNNIISEIKVRKENIEKNQDKMPIHLLEGGLMAFESSIDVIKDLFEQFKKK